MLKELRIRNLAVIEQTDISLNDGLNVFTGETGAGKSILIDAIHAVLGARSFKDMIRHGAEKATVSAVFCHLSDKLHAKLEACGMESEDDTLLLQREISLDGKSVARVNGQQVPASLLREIGSFLVNIHGQHDNQLLLDEKNHIDILDFFLPDRTLRDRYRNKFREVVAVRRDLKAEKERLAEKQAKKEDLQLAVERIEAFDLHPGELDALSAKRELLKNREKLLSHLNTAKIALEGAPDLPGALSMFEAINLHIESAAELYAPLDALAEQAQDAYDKLIELADKLSAGMETVQFDVQEQSEIEERLFDLKDLIKHYSPTDPTETGLLSFLDAARQELESLDTTREKYRQLEEQGAQLFRQLMELGKALSEARAEAAKRFTASLKEQLSFLDMPNAVFEVKMEPCKPNAHGLETVEFLLSTNPGELPKPLAKIASGGELSRIMLAFQVVLSGMDAIPTVIFDEIDTGVSGRAANKIGRKLKEVSKLRQVLCVTHASQVAAQADHHYLIQKETDGKKTFTKVTPLDFYGRVDEVARIMGTDPVTQLTLDTAAEMLRAAGIFPEFSEIGEIESGEMQP